MKQHPERHVVDEREIAERHFTRLRSLLGDEEKRDRLRFKGDVADRKPEERERRGKALLRLVLRESHFTPSGQRLLSFALRSGRFLPRYSLQVGDVVQLSGFETAAAEKITGTVYDRNPQVITVAFHGRLPGWVGHEAVYQLTLAENLTTYARMYEAIEALKTAKHCPTAVIRDISLGLKKPRFGDPVSPSDLEFFDTRLNELQKLAVTKALESEDVFLVHGPPGTGKTRVLVEVIAQARKKDEQVLVSAPSNAACDHLVEKMIERGIRVTRLGHPARMTERIRAHTLAYQLARHDYAKEIDRHEARLEQLARQKERRQDRRVMTREEVQAMREEVRFLRDDIRLLRAQIFQEVWNVSDVVVATHTVCADPMIKGRFFDWVIVDEATQGIEPATWIPILRLSGRAVLAGDHCQLPPTVFSPRTGKDTLNFTLFERLHEVLPPESRVRLETQYRMHEWIMNYPSGEFYDGKLAADRAVRVHQITDLPGVRGDETLRKPVIFLDTAGLGYEEKNYPGSQSRFNEEEAVLVVREYRRLVEAGVSPADIAVISPYNAQVRLIAGMIRPSDREDAAALEGPEIDSVDAFQGREKEAVIVSLVRSNLTGNLGFLADTRRMNVAMTRARRKLIVVGDSATLCNIPFYKNFIQYVESVSGYLSAWEFQA